jgi:hypothetical protein
MLPPPSQQFPLLDGTFVKSPNVSSFTNDRVLDTESFVSSIRWNTSTFGSVDVCGLIDSVTASTNGVEGAPMP